MSYFIKFAWLGLICFVLAPLYAESVLLENYDDFLMADDHPAKAALDEIFSEKHVLASLKAMKSAGFIAPYLRPKQLVIGIHPKLKGYLLKLYLDVTAIDEDAEWVKRINGALLIHKAIVQHGYQSIMVVPKKWIYRLPTQHMPAKGLHIAPKRSVLVVEDMHLVGLEENSYFYKNEITYAHLDALIRILIECRLIDSLTIQNIPLTHKGQIAFIDTELAGKSLSIWLRIRKFGKNLSPEKEMYWEKLIRKGKSW